MSPEAIRAMGAGCAIGLVLGVALHDYLLGLAIGVVFGVAIYRRRRNS